MKIQFLGTGTSVGVPMIGCQCAVCKSHDPRDNRLRSSVVIEKDGHRLLIDCGPDFRQQCLRYGYTHFDAVLLTHKHYDHVGGLDDIRPLGNCDIYSDSDVQEAIHRCLPYCFGEKRYPGAPVMTLHEIEAYRPFTLPVFGEILPLRIMHGWLPILGYRIGSFAYITDCKTMPQETLEALKGVDTLVLNALRWEDHPAHLTIEEALILVNQIRPRETYFTHFCHRLGLHAEAEKKLPPHVHLAYDGLSIQTFSGL